MVPDIETNPFYVDCSGYTRVITPDEICNLFKFTKKEDYIPNPKKIIYHDPATIVFWEDGTKTVVKCSPSETYNKYVGFCACLAKKIYGNNSRVNRIVKSGIEEK